MGRKFWQTKKFKEIEKEWYAKLSADKFPDAEQLINGKLVLRQKANNCYRQACQVARENKLRYFELLGACFHKEAFKDDVEAFVMEQRAHGVKIKRICEELKAMGERNHRDTVYLIIRKYEVKWGIKG